MIKSSPRLIPSQIKPKKRDSLRKFFSTFEKYLMSKNQPTEAQTIIIIVLIKKTSTIGIPPFP